MNAPNMISEVIESVHLMYEDLPDVELDCMLYLKNLLFNCKDVNGLGQVYEWFAEHDRCQVCGEMLESYTYKEPHPELDECPVETLTELYCPNCHMT